MKEDLRVIKTKKAIEEAFVSLIEEKGFENVKIIDIAKRANVNRNTIYLHYSSKDMIIEDLVDKVFTSGIVTLEPNAYLKGKYSKKNLYDLFFKIFTLIYDHIELYRMSLKYGSGQMMLIWMACFAENKSPFTLSTHPSITTSRLAVFSSSCTACFALKNE